MRNKYSQAITTGKTVENASSMWHDAPSRFPTTRRVLSLWICAASLLTATSSVCAQGDGSGDLERFLPNDGNSVYNVSGLLRQWPSEGPKQLWATTVGPGKSAVVESRGRAFTAAEIDDKQWAVCLDAASGKSLWKHLLHPDKNRHFTQGPISEKASICFMLIRF